MADLTLAYEARSYSSGTPGRAICNARNHHIVADGPGGEALGAGELFLSGIAACAVNMVHRVAQSDAIPMNWLDVRVASYQDPDKEPGQLTVWDEVQVHLEIWGVDDDQGTYLVDVWKKR